MRAEHKKITTDLQRQLTSLNTQCTKLTSLETQYKHEIKRCEREIEKQKEKLATLVNDKGGNKKAAGMDILNTLPREGGARGVWKAGIERNV